MKTQETAIAVKQESTLVANLGFNPFDLATSKQGFESQEIEFFDANGMEGIEMCIFLKEMVTIEIKGEDKEFAKGYLQMAEGEKCYHFGQHQIVTTLKRNDKGKGVLAFVTFEGKKTMKNSSKTLNHFAILAKSL